MTLISWNRKELSTVRNYQHIRSLNKTIKLQLQLSFITLNLTSCEYAAYNFISCDHKRGRPPPPFILICLLSVVFSLFLSFLTSHLCALWVIRRLWYTKLKVCQTLTDFKVLRSKMTNTVILFKYRTFALCCHYEDTTHKILI